MWATLTHIKMIYLYPQAQVGKGHGCFTVFQSTLDSQEILDGF